MRKFVFLIILLLLIPVQAQDDIITQTQPVADYIAAHQEDVAVWCGIGGDAMITHNADEPFALASTFKVFVLAEMARQMDVGLIDPDEAVAIADVNAYWLPGTDGGAHDQFLNYLEDAETLTLREIAYGMIRFSSNAATDYLITRLNMADEAFSPLFEMLDIENAQIPDGTLLGLFLVLSNHETGLNTLTDAEAIAEESARLADLFVNDEAWHDAELAYQEEFDVSDLEAEYERQNTFFNTYGFYGSASDIMKVMTAAYEGDAFSTEARTLMQDTLNWPMDVNPANEAVYSALGMKGGSWAGILTAAWYVQPIDLEPLTLVVFYRNLPPDVWEEWFTTGTQQLLEVRTFAYGEGCAPFAEALGM